MYCSLMLSHKHSQLLLSWSYAWHGPRKTRAPREPVTLFAPEKGVFACPRKGVFVRPQKKGVLFAPKTVVHLITGLTAEVEDRDVQYY